MIAFYYTILLISPHILCGVGGHGIAQGGHRDDADTLHTHSGGEACQHLRAEAVDHGLNQHHTDGHGGLLENGWKSHTAHG